MARPNSRALRSSGGQTGFPSGHTALIQSCWKSGPENRPHFNEVCITIAFATPNLSGKAAQSGINLSPIEELRQLADSGDGRAQVQFGEKLERGDGLEKNLSKSVRYSRLGSDQSSGEGIAAFARCFVERMGTATNPEAAAVIFRRTADDGLSEGQFRQEGMK